MQQAPPEKVKKLLVLHLTFFSVLLIATLISLGMVSLHIAGVLINDYHGEIVLTSALISLCCFLASWFLYNRRIKKIRATNEPLETKLTLLIKADKMRWVVLSAASTICILAFLFTGEMNIFILILGLLLVFYLTRPTAMSIATDLKVREYDVLNLE